LYGRETCFLKETTKTEGMVPKFDGRCLSLKGAGIIDWLLSMFRHHIEA
jgi:hypothetical protein